MSSELPRSLSEAAEWLRARRISSRDLTQTLLARAKATQDSIGAFVAFTEESAVAAATRADEELASGVDRGPLQGIPIGIKDILATQDAPTTANSRVLDPAWGNRHDATSVRKLREAGAVILGKLALHEFAIGTPDRDSGLPFARNPWNPAHMPGGSSSGTGAAVAAGLIFGGLGTDTGGSIRGPAAYCGISGLKPTFGRVSKEGCVPLSFSLDHIGPMAHTVRDCALMLQVIAGDDPLDPCTASEAVPDYAAGLSGSVQGLRVGVPRQFFFDAPELKAEVLQAVENALADLQRAGVTLRDLSLPHAASARIAQRVIMLSEAYAYHRQDLIDRPELYGRHTRRQFLNGALYSSADYVQAQRLRSVIKAEVCQAMQDVDVLIAPTALGAAPEFETYDPDSMRRLPSFMSIWNLVGLPAASIPCGFSSAGLPIGMQIVGKAFDEGTVLRVGDAYQQLTDWHRRTPELTVVEPQLI